MEIIKHNFYVILLDYFRFQRNIVYLSCVLKGYYETPVVLYLSKCAWLHSITGPFWGKSSSVFCINLTMSCEDKSDLTSCSLQVDDGGLWRSSHLSLDQPVCRGPEGKTHNLVFVLVKSCVHCQVNVGHTALSHMCVRGTSSWNTKQHPQFGSENRPTGPVWCWTSLFDRSSFLLFPLHKVLILQIRLQRHMSEHSWRSASMKAFCGLWYL